MSNNRYRPQDQATWSVALGCLGRGKPRTQDAKENGVFATFRVVIGIAASALLLGLVTASGVLAAPEAAIPNSPIKIKYSYSRGPGGSLTGRVVYSSKYLACVAPGRIKYGGDISPQFYAFVLHMGTTPVEVQGEFKLPRVGPHTYELTLSGSTPIREKIGGTEYEAPLSSYESVQFLFAIGEKSGQEQIITVRRHGEKFRVYCGGPGSTPGRQIQIEL
jgi:hypothetical protein